MVWLSLLFACSLVVIVCALMLLSLVLFDYKLDLSAKSLPLPLLKLLLVRLDYLLTTQLRGYCLASLDCVVSDLHRLSPQKTFCESLLV